MSTAYETIIGLEVHVQLLCPSKLFCGCSTKFGSPPNTQTCPVCIGMPGTLPVLNRRAVELSVKAALGLNCSIARFTKWDRKSYYYPDLPKGFQISQFDLPLSYDGYLSIADPENGIPAKNVGIIRAHLEEDAGKSMHDELSGKADSRIDLNRCGTPLLEIVSRPDLRSSAEARLFLTELKLLLNYLQVSDCNMQEGSLRVDANINLHIDTPGGKVATPIVEVKNMNSFRAVQRALDYEAPRQYEAWRETGGRLGEVPKQTRGWDDATQVTKAQRSKEESSDYRYFPEPDLVPVTTTEEYVEAMQKSLGELPAALRTRLQGQYGITPYDADVLVNQGRPLVQYYEDLARLCGDGKQAGNWMQQSVLRTLNEQQIGIEDFAVAAVDLAELIKAVGGGKLETSRARDVLAEMLASDKSADEATRALGIDEVDADQLETLCREVIEANPQIVEDVKNGKVKAAGALIGQAKRKNPNVNASLVGELCLKLIGQM